MHKKCVELLFKNPTVVNVCLSVTCSKHVFLHKFQTCSANAAVKLKIVKLNYFCTIEYSHYVFEINVVLNLHICYHIQYVS